MRPSVQAGYHGLKDTGLPAAARRRIATVVAAAVEQLTVEAGRGLINSDLEQCDLVIDARILLFRQGPARGATTEDLLRAVPIAIAAITRFLLDQEGEDHE